MATDELVDAVDKLTDAWKQIGKIVEELTDSLCEIFNVMREDGTVKIQSMSPKRYGISLMEDCRGESKGCNLYRIERKVQRHLPYQRRIY